jgi:hypothetical protein
MSIGPGQHISAVVKWAQEWQRLSFTATNEFMGRYLHGCANMAMACTPHQALAEVEKTWTSLLRHSAETIGEATRLWRKQNTEPTAKLRASRFQ